MVKKLSVFFLCLIMVFSFAACNNADLEKKISDLETKISDLETKTKTLEDSNKALTDSLTELEDENGGLLDTIGELEETIEGLKDEIFNADVFIYYYTDAYMSEFRPELESMLFSAGISPTFYDGQNNQSLQTSQIESAISRGTDLLIVNTIASYETSVVNNIVNKAKAADIPIIFFNREIGDTQLNSYDNAAFVGTNPADAGRKQGQMIAEYLLKAENTTDSGTKSKFADSTGNINYVMLRGEVGNLEAQYRTMYSVTIAQQLITAAGKSWTLVNSSLNTTTGDLTGLKDEFGNALTAAEEAALGKYIYGNWDQTEAYNLCKTQFTAANVVDKTKLGIIIANNDDQALGAIAALNDVNYNKGSGDFVPVFGVDATDAAVEAIEAKKMHGSIKQDNIAMAAAIAQLVGNIAAGSKLMAGTLMYNIDATAAKIRIPYGIVTA